MTLRTIALTTADGRNVTLADYADQVVLIVNVASKCGLTVQYEALEDLQRTYGDRGFTVLGFPCNQFKGQEPGSMEAILEFCSTTYGVTFPLFDKIEVNGADRPGFLYDVTSTLTNLGLQIVSAHISTYGERVVDVFYVKDVFGLKIDQPQKFERLEAALLDAIQPPEEGVIVAADAAE
jgi:glutathione peroxidase-family protein